MWVQFSGLFRAVGGRPGLHERRMIDMVKHQAQVLEAQCNSRMSMRTMRRPMGLLAAAPSRLKEVMETLFIRIASSSGIRAMGDALSLTRD